MTENMQCAQTGELFPREKTIRFVPGPDHALIADLAEELPGDGVRLLGQRTVIETALRDGLFVRLFDGKPVIAPSFLDGIEGRLCDRVSGLIGLARRAGAVLSGFAKVEAGLKSNRCNLVFTASDGAEDGKMKIARLAEAVNCPQVTLLPSTRLSVALGQTNVIHAAIAGSGWAGRVNAAVDRLSLYVNGHGAA